MSKKSVIIYICDNCGTEADPEQGLDHKHPLPKEWVTVTMTTNEKWLEEIQLCDDCRADFAAALLRRRS